VQTFIIKLVINEHFNKVKLCNDGSYRNNVILIRPDGLHVTHGEFTLENFNDHMNNIETLWINITDKTWKEIDEEMKWMDDMYPDEYYEECYYD